MKKITIYSLVILIICFNCPRLFSQVSINKEALDNFYEYRSEITDYFTYYYDEEYPNDMLYYKGKLMTMFGNIIDRKIISNEIIDAIIELYRETLALKVPDDDKEMYVEAGLGENGHELYTKILSIMYFMDLEKNIHNFPQKQQETARNGVNKLKNLFTRNDWDITVNYFNKKYSR
jgi:hypothetical protein